MLRNNLMLESVPDPNLAKIDQSPAKCMFGAFSEGFSVGNRQEEIVQCVTTAFTASRLDPQKWETS
jgi:hypothetical protein